MRPLTQAATSPKYQTTDTDRHSPPDVPCKKYNFPVDVCVIAPSPPYAFANGFRHTSKFSGFNHNSYVKSPANPDTSPTSTESSPEKPTDEPTTGGRTTTSAPGCT